MTLTKKAPAKRKFERAVTITAPADLSRQYINLNRHYGPLSPGQYNVMAEGPDWFRLTNGVYVPKVLQFDKPKFVPRWVQEKQEQEQAN